MLQARLKLATYAAAASLYNTDLAAITTVLGPVYRTGNQTINMPKIDWQVNEKNHASFIYNRLGWRSPGGVQTQATNNYSIDGFGNDFVKLDYGIAKLDTVLTTNIVNEVRYQYGRELNNESSQPVTPTTTVDRSDAFRASRRRSHCRAPTASATASNTILPPRVSGRAQVADR